MSTQLAEGFLPDLRVSGRVLKIQRIQSETAVRHLANSYAYDHGEEHEITLRSGMDEVSAALRRELQERLNKAGVLVDEARLTHLAYGTHEPSDLCFYPRSNKLAFSGVGVIVRVEPLDYWDGEG